MKHFKTFPVTKQVETRDKDFDRRKFQIPQTLIDISHAYLKSRKSICFKLINRNIQVL